MVHQVSHKGNRWVALIALALATVRCGGGAFSSDPGAPDAYVPTDAADDGAAPDGAIDATAVADASGDEDRGRPLDGGRRDATLEDAGSGVGAAGDDGESRADAQSSGHDAGPKDGGAPGVDATAEDAGGSADSGTADTDANDAAPCVVPCGEMCCPAGDQCCTTLLVRLDGGTGTSHSCQSGLLVCPLAAPPESN